MFLTIQEGEYTININLISEIDWLADAATITMVTGVQYDVDGKDFEALKKAIGM